jgi:acyl dehydratase
MSRREVPRGTPSMAAALGRLALNSLRPDAPRPLPQRVGRDGLGARPAALRRYLDATGGREVARFAGDDAVLPPVYPCLWELPLVLELLAAAGEGLPRGVVHLSSERVFVRAPRVRDTLRCEVRLDHEQHGPTGIRRVLSCRTGTPGGDLCTHTVLAFLFAPRRATVSAPPTEEPERAGEAELARWSLRADHGRRYARASGDYNPIHLWSLTARPFGYRRPILHGLCLEAMVAHAIIARRLGGEPCALRRLRIGFRRPALLPAELRLLVAPPSAGGSGGVFRVTRPDGRTVAEGEWGGVRR